jgi:hypothetical protein
MLPNNFVNPTFQRSVQHRQQHKRCIVIECPNPRLPFGSLCRKHHKHETRTGSAFHNALTQEECRLYRNRIQSTMHQLLRKRDESTTLMVRSLICLLHGLPRNMPRLNDIGRSHCPLLKAQAILFHADRQRYLKSRQRTSKTENRFAVLLLASMMAAELAASRLTDLRMYRATQVCHAIRRLIWKREQKVYELDNGRGEIRSYLVYSYRPALQSKAVVRRLYGLVEPIYRFWLRDYRSKFLANINPLPQSPDLIAVNN